MGLLFQLFLKSDLYPSGLVLIRLYLCLVYHLELDHQICLFDELPELSTVSYAASRLASCLFLLVFYVVV